MTKRLLFLSLCLAGCASITTSPVNGVGTREVALIRTPRRSGPTVYTARLVSSDDLARLANIADSDSVRSSGTVRLIVQDDDTFEYQLTIYNDTRRTFTTAGLYRGTPSPSTVVATLFAGEALNSRYIQLRGTGSVARTLDAHAVMDQVRGSPDGFVIRIDSRSRTGGSLQGPLR